MFFKETAILLALFLARSCGPAEAQALRSDQYLPGPPGCYAKTAAGVRVCEQQERLRAEQQKNYERLRVEQQKRDEQIRIQQEARKLQEQKQQAEREAEYARQRAENDRIIREREEQEKIIKARFLEEYEAAKSTYQKDIIAQVLNYSSTGNEYGSERQFWRAPLLVQRRGGFGYTKATSYSPTIRAQTGGHQGGHSDRPILCGQKLDLDRVREIDGLSRRLDGRRGRLIGNAVAPPIAEFIGRTILKIEQGEEQRPAIKAHVA
jgi:hypothetical protein